MTTQAEYSDIFETAVTNNQKDNKGRVIGYIVRLVNNGTDFRALVQNARLVKGEWEEFGVRQASRSFTGQDTARRWAYQTAKERLATPSRIAAK